MKIAVIGAGIVGICTAYELALDGHSVSVFERHGAVAEEASFACAPHQSPSLAHAMAAPAWPQSSRLRALLSPSGISLGRGTSWKDLRWLSGWKAAPKGFLERFAAAQTLARYSLERQQALTLQASLVFEQSQGQLLLFRSERDVLAYQDQLAALNAQGAAAKVLTPEEARKLEPALGSDVALHAALHLPHDAQGNCRQFAHALRDKATELGVRFHFSTAVSAVSHTPAITLHTDRLGAQQFDHIVACAGSGAASLLAFKQAPLTRVWSCSLSAHIREPLNAPRSAVLDGHSQVSITRLGGRIRVSGGAELGGRQHQKHGAVSKLLYQTLQTHFPGAADFSRSMQLWRGASMFSPDALPLLGPSGRPGIWLNLAHGHNGWSMACGSARLLADMIRGRPAELDTTLVQPGRFIS